MFDRLCPAVLKLKGAEFTCDLPLGHDGMHEEGTYLYDQEYIVKWDDGIRINNEDN